MIKKEYSLSGASERLRHFLEEHRVRDITWDNKAVSREAVEELIEKIESGEIKTEDAKLESDT